MTEINTDDAALRIRELIVQEPGIFSWYEQADLLALLDERERLRAQADAWNESDQTWVTDMRASFDAGWTMHAGAITSMLGAAEETMRNKMSHDFVDAVILRRSSKPEQAPPAGGGGA